MQPPDAPVFQIIVFRSSLAYPLLCLYCCAGTQSISAVSAAIAEFLCFLARSLLQHKREASTRLCGRGAVSRVDAKVTACTRSYSETNCGLHGSHTLFAKSSAPRHVPFQSADPSSVRTLTECTVPTQQGLPVRAKLHSDEV